MPNQDPVRAHVAAGSVVAGCVVALALVDGGYFPTTWGAALLVSALAAGIAVIVSETFEVGLRDVAFVAGIAGFGVWQLSSMLWSSGSDGPVLEAERTLVYVTAIAALFLWARTTNADALVAGMGLGTVLAALIGLIEHLASSSPTEATARLAQPIGYANADGLLAGLGLLFALAAASRGRRLWIRAAAAGAAVPLAVGLYLSLSRGAILATTVGLVVILVVDERRIELAAVGLIVAVPVIVAVAIAARSPIVGDDSSADVAGAGERLLVEVVILAAAAAVGSIAAARLERRIALSPRRRRRLEVVLTLSCLLALSLATAVGGGPARIAGKVVHSFAASAPLSDVRSARLVSASGSFRAEYWHVAWHAARREPVHGTGAGSFEREWLAERSIDQNVRNVHNLYLEVLAELGWVGLLILGAALVVPLTAVARARSRPLMPAAAGVYVAYLAHASVDWDWQVPALTILALAAGAVMIVAAREAPPRPITPGGRIVALCVVAPLVAVAVAIHAGQWRLEEARRSLERGNFVPAANEAITAERWLPWAAEPWLVRGEALLASDDVVGARNALRHASRMDSGNWEVWYDLALVEQGRARATALERARQLNPRSPELAALGGS